MQLPENCSMKLGRSFELITCNTHCFLERKLLSQGFRTFRALTQMRGNFLLRSGLKLIVCVEVGLIPPLATHNFAPAVLGLLC